MTLFGQEGSSCLSVQQPEKRQTEQTTEEPGFSEGFDVVVMDVIYDQTVVDGLKYLSDSDLKAIADYLFAQPPMVHDVTGKR